MGKKSASRRAPSATASTASGADIPVVAAREPCPCGSGRRYKACHGRAAGHAAEPSSAGRSRAWPASATGSPCARSSRPRPRRLTLAGEHAGQSVDAGHRAAAGLARAGAAGRRGVRRPAGAGGSGDANRDVAHALERALAAEPGTPIAPTALPGAGPGCRTCSTRRPPSTSQVHDGFDFWLEGVDDRSPEVVASMERANEAVVPTVRLTSVEAAYWCQIRDRRHLRWVRAARRGRPARRAGPAARRRRRHRRGGLALRRLVPADGLVVPVWDLDPGTSAEALEEPVDAFAARLGEALADTSPLDDAERRARAGLRSRQLTLR